MTNLQEVIKEALQDSNAIFKLYPRKKREESQAKYVFEEVKKYLDELGKN